MSESQSGQGLGHNAGSTNQLAGAAKYGAVGVLGFLAGAGTLWSVTAREPAPVIAAQQPAPIVIQPPQVVIQMPAQPPSAGAPSTPSTPAAPIEPGVMGPEMPATPVATTPPTSEPVAVAPVVTTPAGQTTPGPQPAATPTRATKLNINTATSAQIELLPGIGPALAGRIVAYRTAHGRFTSIADLDKVDGIGPKTLERLAPLISVE